MNEIGTDKILTLLEKQRGFDFSGYRLSLVERRIQKRMLITKSGTYEEYLDYLKLNFEELDSLVDSLTINVSRFFRNSLVFECLAKKVLPDLIMSGLNSENNDIRVWSAGCANGEEPYSIAMIFNELIEKEKELVNLKIFASDIDHKALLGASQGVYGLNSMKNVKLGILEKYFIKEESSYKLAEEIKNKVQFSAYDLLNKNSFVPPESIFGDFDLVFCRNVLIYFNQEYQKIIFNKLYRSLKQNGYLVLGEAEMPVEGYIQHFKRVNNLCKIYRKVN